MDRSKFDYIPLDLPNIMAQVPKGQANTLTINPIVYEIATTIAKRKPSWTLVFAGTLPKFSIYEGQEKLGSIERGSCYAKDPYIINNDRAKATVTRNRSVRTVDIKKALKLVFKHFYTKTPVEKISALSQNVINAANGQHYQGLLAFQHLYVQFTKTIQDEVMRDFARLHDIAKQGAAPVPVTYRDLPGKYETTLLTGEIMDNTAKGVVVCFVSDAYYIGAAGGGPEAFRAYTSDELTDHWKKCIGLLKLSEDKTFVQDIGYRLSEEVFYVVPEEN